jgi:hypothetical protein
MSCNTAESLSVEVLRVADTMIILQFPVWQPDNLCDAWIFWLPHIITLAVSSLPSGAWNEKTAILTPIQQ